MSRPEILAPAGNREMLGAAVFSGADAVYLGLTGFNARRTAGNFTPDELREAVAFCHARGVKVHVTLNTLVYDRELSGLADAVRAVAAAGADAVIADDLATAQLVKSIAPTLHLHGSTQMSVHTPEGAKELAALGYDRVILARELSLEEIRAVCEASPIEVEVFVHGALCMSVSGQCMMSAFLGGRSGNRGACAGPCRLPFDASAGLKPGQPGRACHLSLKDMDYIPHLRELMDAGVASVKIEGRLRTPEYAAAVVTACRAVCAGQPYDEKLVRDIFSRSGFTDGYLTNRNDGKMFGVRTEADAAATRAATPKARELFRRELQRVPVHYELSGGVEDGGVKLTARDDDGHRVSVYSADEPQPAQKDPLPGIERALGKTGGTPFVMDGLAAEPGEGGFGFLPGAAWNELRREALDKLLEKRSEVTPHAVQAFEMPTYPAHTVGQLPALAARFANAAQCPAEAAEKLQYLIFPITEAESIPEAWRGKTLLELPRVMFGRLEQKTAARLDALQDAGFAGAVVNNPAQLAGLAQRRGKTPAQLRYTDGWTLYGGLGLNVTNPMSAARYASLGVQGMLLQPETALTAMQAVAPGVPTAALCYGHLPLMLTRACPLRNVRDCGKCPGGGTLRDRKGRDFTVTCSAPGGAGVRTVFNPVPLYMGERLRELPVDVAVAAFTTETPARVSQILDLLFNAQPFDSEFTRGLYYTNN